MSKAFTREDDDRPEEMVGRRATVATPSGRNLLTPGGARRLHGELCRLRDEERPALMLAAAAGGVAGGEAQERLSRVNARLAELQQSLALAEVVRAPAPPRDTVQFGAMVTVRAGDGAESSYRIVGVDEADAARGEVSWLSPIARALLNTRGGQRVTFRFPRGEAELEIVRIDYEE